MKILNILLIIFLIINISLVQAQPKPVIQKDSSPGVPIVLDNQTLFIVKTSIGGLSIQQRAQRINHRLQEYADNYALSIDDLGITHSDQEGIPLSAITAEDILILLLSEKDAELAGKSRKELAEEYLEQIKKVVIEYRKERSPEYLIKGLIITSIASIFIVLILLIINNLFKKIYKKLQAWGNSYINAINIGNFQLIEANQLDDLVTFITKISQRLIIIAILITYLIFVLGLFPWTKNLAQEFWQAFHQVLAKEISNFVSFLPNLLSIILVSLITYFLLRLCKSCFRKLSEGSVILPGFYPEWALPTNRIVSFLLIALSAVIVFPLLPGFNSPAFQGISVFLGLLFSLGSTSIIANIVAGTILIYTRSFRVGDRIKIGKISGQVIETTLLVTRLLTSTNVVISIPNSKIINSSIKNFNFAPKELDKPLIVRTEVYLGYEVNWQQAYQALIEAALLTEGIVKSPKPFVLQAELNKVYVTYLLNVYLDSEYFVDTTGIDIEKACSQLHENIRNSCEKAGIRIFAPSYEADPTIYGPASSKI